jgi:hypothetical protein
MLTSSGPVQTTYSQYMTAGKAGMPATMTGWDIDTFLCEDPSSPEVGIGFGLAVSQGTLHGDKSAGLGHISGGDFIGVTVLDPTLANLDTAFTDKYRDGENMAVLVRGDIWVEPAVDVVPGDNVTYDSTTGVFSKSGGTAIKNARWMTSSSTDVNPRCGGLAILRITHPTDNDQ